MYGSGEIKNGLIAAAWGTLYKLMSDLTQQEKFVKLVLKSPKGSGQLCSLYSYLYSSKLTVFLEQCSGNTVHCSLNQTIVDIQLPLFITIDNINSCDQFQYEKCLEACRSAATKLFDFFRLSVERKLSKVIKNNIPFQTSLIVFMLPGMQPSHEQNVAEL